MQYVSLDIPTVAFVVVFLTTFALLLFVGRAICFIDIKLYSEEFVKFEGTSSEVIQRLGGVIRADVPLAPGIHGVVPLEQLLLRTYLLDIEDPAA